MANETNGQVLDQRDAEAQQDGQEEQQGSQQADQTQQHTGNDNGQKTFTQDQVNRMMAREKRQGRAAAYRELGIDPKDSDLVSALKETLASYKKSTGSDDTVTQLEHRTLVAEAKAEAMQQGAQLAYVDDIVTLALNKLEDGTDVGTVVGEVKTKYPIWFQKADDQEQKQKPGSTESQEDKSGDQSTNGKQVSSKGTGSSVANRSNASRGESMGARLAQQRKGNGNSKKSFWG